MSTISERIEISPSETTVLIEVPWSQSTWPLDVRVRQWRGIRGMAEPFGTPKPSSVSYPAAGLNAEDAVVFAAALTRAAEVAQLLDQGRYTPPSHSLPINSEACGACGASATMLEQEG
jgi:hypothetical protein